MKSLVIKISGEFFKKKDNLLSEEKGKIFANALKLIANQFSRIYVIVGGGNFIRGRLFNNLVVPRFIYDEIGMNATNINAQWLSWYLKGRGLSSIVLTTGKNTFISNQSEFFSSYNDKLNQANPKIVILGGGTTMPYISTDTLTIITTLRTNSVLALFAKEGIDGVYTADPKIDKNAKLIKHEKFETVIKKQLRFIDLSATQIAYDAKVRKEKHIELKIFKFEKEEDLKNVLINRIKHTTIN